MPPGPPGRIARGPPAAAKTSTLPLCFPPLSRAHPNTQQMHRSLHHKTTLATQNTTCSAWLAQQAGRQASGRHVAGQEGHAICGRRLRMCSASGTGVTARAKLRSGGKAWWKRRRAWAARGLLGALIQGGESCIRSWLEAAAAGAGGGEIAAAQPSGVEGAPRVGRRRVLTWRRQHHARPAPLEQAALACGAEWHQGGGMLTNQHAVSGQSQRLVLPGHVQPPPAPPPHLAPQTGPRGCCGSTGRPHRRSQRRCRGPGRRGRVWGGWAQRRRRPPGR